MKQIPEFSVLQRRRCERDTPYIDNLTQVKPSPQTDNKKLATANPYSRQLCIFINRNPPGSYNLRARVGYRLKTRLQVL